MRLLAVQFCGGVDVYDSDALDGLSSSAVGIGGGRRRWALAWGVGGGRRRGAAVQLLVLIWVAARFDICGSVAFGGGARRSKRGRCVVSLTLFVLEHLTV